MTDVSQLPDADLMASLPPGVRNNNPLNLKDAGGNFRTFPTQQDGMAAADQNLQAYHAKHGINTISGVTARWAPAGDGSNDPAAYAAHVAKLTGIDPNAPVDMTDPATRQKILGAMSVHENGGQVLPQSNDLSGISDADLLASIQQAPTATASAAGPPVAQAATPMPARAAPPPAVRPAPPPARPSPTIAQDALSGFTQPLVNLGHDVMQNYRAHATPQPMPASPLAFAQRSLSDLGGTAKLVGDTLGAVPAAITGAFVRPTARALNTVLPNPTQAPQLSFAGGKPVLSAPQQLHGAAAQASTENVLNTALSGARPAAPGWKFGAGYGAREAAVPRSLEQMREASDAAWTAVDKSNYRFPKTDAVGMAKDVATTFEDAGGADLYPRAAPLVRRINNLANGSDGLSVAQVNRLRSQIGSKLLQPGSDEADMGAILKDRVEGLIQTAKDPELADARDLYTRLKKMQEVTDRADSAALKTPQNGSAVQPTRTAMRPLIDPKSPQRIRNLTPDETAAITKLAKGNASDAPLAIGRFFDPRSVIGSTSNLILGALTGGHAPLVTAPLGVASTAISNAQTRKAVQSVLDLISAGGMKPGASPVYPTLALGGRPALPIMSGPGLIGGSALATLPSRMSSARSSASKRP